MPRCFLGDRARPSQTQPRRPKKSLNIVPTCHIGVQRGQRNVKRGGNVITGHFPLTLTNSFAERAFIETSFRCLKTNPTYATLHGRAGQYLASLRPLPTLRFRLSWAHPEPQSAAFISVTCTRTVAHELRRQRQCSGRNPLSEGPGCTRSPKPHPRALPSPSSSSTGPAQARVHLHDQVYGPE